LPYPPGYQRAEREAVHAQRRQDMSGEVSVGIRKEQASPGNSGEKGE
jgi:hypothetical protein